MAALGYGALGHNHLAFQCACSGGVSARGLQLWGRSVLVPDEVRDGRKTCAVEFVSGVLTI